MEYPRNLKELLDISKFEPYWYMQIEKHLLKDEMMWLNEAIKIYSQMMKSKIESFLKSEGYSVDAIDDFS